MKIHTYFCPQDLRKQLKMGPWTWYLDAFMKRCLMRALTKNLTYLGWARRSGVHIVVKSTRRTSATSRSCCSRSKRQHVRTSQRSSICPLFYIKWNIPTSKIDPGSCQTVQFWAISPPFSDCKKEGLYLTI